MKPRLTAIILVIVLAIVLFYVGLNTWGSFFELILPIVGDVKYLSTNMAAQFQSSLVFSVSLALIPIITFIIWTKGPVKSIRNKILTIGIILITMLAFVTIRHEMIKSKARHLKPVTVFDYSDVNNPVPKKIELLIPEADLKFELFAFAGLLTGSLISFFALRQPIQPSSAYR